MNEFPYAIKINPEVITELSEANLYCLIITNYLSTESRNTRIHGSFWRAFKQIQSLWISSFIVSVPCSIYN